MRVRGEMGGIETVCLAAIMARPSRPYQCKFSELELLLAINTLRAFSPKQLQIIRLCRIMVHMVFIETSAFTKFITKHLSDDEYLGLQNFLLKYPNAGRIVRGTGGVRKLRWSIPGKGKRGGLRVIYYWRVSQNEIWMLTVYGKSERESIPAHVLKKIAEEINHV